MYRRRIANPRQGENDVCWIQLSNTGKRDLQVIKINNNTAYENMIQDIVSEMRDIQFNLYNGIKTKIYTLVPSDTGLLRDNLHRSLDDRNAILPPQFPRHLGQIELRIGFYSTLPYLKHVKKFKTRNIAHPQAGKKKRNISWKTGQPLYDPKAKKGFMSTIKAELKRMARRETKRMLNNLSIAWGWERRDVRSLFEMKNYNFYGY